MTPECEGWFARHDLAASLCLEEPSLSPRPLGTLTTPGTAEAGDRLASECSLCELVDWMPPGLHAAVGAPGIGQQELACAVARTAAEHDRVLLFSLEMEASAIARALAPAEIDCAIDIIDAPAIGLDDIDSVLDRGPAWRIVVVDSFERVVPPHGVGSGHFARWRLAFGLASLASSRQVALLVTGVVRARCMECGCPGPSSAFSLASDPSGLSHEAHWLWRVDREAYWVAGGRSEIDVSVTGRDGTSALLTMSAEDASPCQQDLGEDTPQG